MVASSRIKLRSLDANGRHDQLAETTGLDQNALQALRPEHGPTVEQADHMIENAVGTIGIPVGIACNFVINGREVLVPMATEEPDCRGTCRRRDQGPPDGAGAGQAAGGLDRSRTREIIVAVGLAQNLAAVSRARGGGDPARPYVFARKQYRYRRRRNASGTARGCRAPDQGQSRASRSRGVGADGVALVEGGRSRSKLAASPGRDYSLQPDGGAYWLTVKTAPCGSRICASRVQSVSVVDSTVAPRCSASAAESSRSATVNVACQCGSRASGAVTSQPKASAKPGGTLSPDCRS